MAARDARERTDNPILSASQVDQEGPLGHAEAVDNIVVVVVRCETRTRQATWPGVREIGTVAARPKKDPAG